MLNKRYGGLADQRAQISSLGSLGMPSWVVEAKYWPYLLWKRRQSAIRWLRIDTWNKAKRLLQGTILQRMFSGFWVLLNHLRSILGRLLILASTVFNSTFLTTVICRRQIPTTNFISRSTVSSHTNRESEIQQTRVFASSNVTSRNAK